LSCGVLCAGILVLTCATSSTGLLPQMASTDPARVASLFNVMSVSKAVLQPAHQVGFRAAAQAAQPVKWGKTFHLGNQVIARAAAEEAPAAEEEPFKGASAWSTQFAEPEAVFDILKVKDTLPHRYPFLLVDKIIELIPGKKAVGIKKVTTNEEFFNGHFPERPIMPGVLQIEAMAQVGGMIALQEPISDGKGQFFFSGLDKVKWRKPVVPGDTLVMEMELTAFKPRFGVVKMKGTSYVDGKKVVEAEFQFAMVK